MTDEERARELAYSLHGEGPGYEAALALASQWIAAIRDEEREKCAQVADKHDTGDMQREDMEARRIAAAIRAMGGKG